MHQDGPAEKCKKPAGKKLLPYKKREQPRKPRRGKTKRKIQKEIQREVEELLPKPLTTKTNKQRQESAYDATK